MSRRATEQQHNRILGELNEERAAALVRISRTLESILAELHTARERLAATPAGERAAALKAHRALRDRALLYRWYLEVQREALGLRHHAILDEVYPIPAPVDEQA